MRFRFDGEISENILRSLRMRYFGRIAAIGSLNHASSLHHSSNVDEEPKQKLPGVKTLSVSGACPELVMDLVRMCVNLECLEVDETMDLKELAWLLPGRVRTLVLGGEEGIKLTEDILVGIRFGDALREGLMSSAREEYEDDEDTEEDQGEERKIVLVTRWAEESALEMAREQCVRYKVRFVHRSITDIV